MNLNYNKHLRRFNFCSKYNFQLYKKFLLTKLFLYIGKDKFFSKFKSYIYICKNSKNLIYNRGEKFPLRLFRYYSMFPINFTNKDFLKSNIFLNTKLKIYNGKKFKPINVFRV